MGRRKNGTGGVSHRKDGRWEGRVVIGYDEKGLPKTKNVLAKTKGECLQKLKALKESLTVEEKPKYGKNMTFGEWIDFWFREFCSPRLKDSTKQTYGYRIYQQIIPNIGHIPLNELKTSDLQAFYAHLKSDGRLIRRELNGNGVSDSHVRGIHAHCNAALNKAVDEGLIFKNPATECRLPPKRYAEMKVLTHEGCIGCWFRRSQKDCSNCSSSISPRDFGEVNCLVCSGMTWTSRKRTSTSGGR